VKEETQGRAYRASSVSIPREEEPQQTYNPPRQPYNRDRRLSQFAIKPLEFNANNEGSDCSEEEENQNNQYGSGHKPISPTKKLP
jgi:hypothetical protein